MGCYHGSEGETWPGDREDERYDLEQREVLVCIKKIGDGKKVLFLSIIIIYMCNYTNLVAMVTIQSLYVHIHQSPSNIHMWYYLILISL